MQGSKTQQRKDKAVKALGGQAIKSGSIIVRGINNYKAGRNVSGLGTLYAICAGRVYFTRKKTSRGKVRTFVNIEPAKTK